MSLPKMILPSPEEEIRGGRHCTIRWRSALTVSGISALAGPEHAFNATLEFGARGGYKDLCVTLIILDNGIDIIRIIGSDE